jgi:hypothetical protein
MYLVALQALLVPTLKKGAVRFKSSHRVGGAITAQ